ncbi:hypothetical protein Taro_025835 [Colocasia esculenta]|uniref:Uncharacterized protein n=1 Tax=Colocasia esculenta TaxID=4460 RepID=A0A843V4H1_COLES|nr:hypothetical protein [Colocasia esculenta]
MCGPLACVSDVCACCEAWWAGRSAQSAHRSCGCERDGGLHRVLNASVLGVAFLLPLFGGRRLHARQVLCTGWPAEVGLGKATVTSVAIRVSWRFEVLVEFSARSHREDVAWSGGNAEGTPVFAFFAKVFACEGDSLGCRDLVATARSVALEFLLQRLSGSRFDGVPGGASALVTFMKCVAHEMGMFYVVIMSCVCACCEAWWAGRWAQSAHRSCGCERDGGLRRVLNASVLGVAFLLPLFGERRLHARQVLCAGWPTEVGLGKVTVTSVAIRAEKALLGQGGSCCKVSWRFEVLVEFSARSHREDVAWSEGNAEGTPVFAFFVKISMAAFPFVCGAFPLIDRVPVLGINSAQNYTIDIYSKQ